MKYTEDENDQDYIIDKFIQLDDKAKEKYADASGTRRKYNGETMTIMLLRSKHEFLNLKKPWVEKLLRAE